MSRKLHFKTTLPFTTKSFLFLLLLFSLHSFAQTTYFVDINRPDNSGDGLSFATAFKDIQVALDATVAGDEVRVAQGTYVPTEPASTSTLYSPIVCFHFDKDITFKGGYDASSGIQDLNTPSILSGDTGNDNTVTGFGATLNIDNQNSGLTTVVLTRNLTTNCLIDGFMMTGGRARSGNVIYSGINISRFGGGMTNNSSSPTMTNITFFGNYATSSGYAGGLYNRNSDPVLRNVMFDRNYSFFESGGVYNINSSPSFTDVRFYGNYSGDQGGGMRSLNTASVITLNNVIFEQNYADQSGGGMSITSNASATLTNVFFIQNNAANLGGGMFARETTNIELINTVFAGNSATGNGGALYNFSTSNVTLTNVTFARNSSSADGGGMYNNLTSPNPVLFNTVFYTNVNASSINDIAGNNIDFSSANNASDSTGGFINLGANFVSLVGNPFVDVFDYNGADDIYGTNDDGLFPNITNGQLVNAGDNTRNTEAGDAAKQVRIADSTIDIGAYESGSTTLDVLENKLISPIVMYPNPATDEITLSSNVETSLVSASIYTMEGKLIRTVDLTSILQIKSIDISELQAASYMMVVTSNQGQTTKMFVKR
ncbi:putative outer membrane protein pmp20 [Kordia sp. SMS9]|uniref:T9SS type A sorting domain-containing protein n=1 Tax=Kordia sp. SMS9 TaxID=2282170 RepID=UPI000E0DCE81|nr:T9SS type A sorting domain-containing protein [Kordia sp. SMS9]AXG69093.1 putative outer membrane protein pmp20 [Kordia sp. SMS9]